MGCPTAPTLSTWSSMEKINSMFSVVSQVGEADNKQYMADKVATIFRL